MKIITRKLNDTSYEIIVNDVVSEIESIEVYQNMVTITFIDVHPKRADVKTTVLGEKKQ